MAELGDVCLAAALEAQLAAGGAALRAARSQVPQQVPPWEWRPGPGGDATGDATGGHGGGRFDQILGTFWGVGVEG